MDVSSFFGSGGFPTDPGGIIKYVLICVLALLAVLLAVYLIAIVIGLIFRLLFRQLRFFVVFILTLAAVAAFAALVFFKPITAGETATGDNTLIEQVAEKYKGLYPSGVPLIAWRVTDITDEITPEEQAATGSIGENEKVYRVSYLPFGELVVRVDPSEGELKITSGADGKPVTANIKDITDNLIGSIARGANKAFDAIGSGVDKGVSAVKDKAQDLADKTPAPTEQP